MARGEPRRFLMFTGNKFKTQMRGKHLSLIILQSILLPNPLKNVKAKTSNLVK